MSTKRRRRSIRLLVCPSCGQIGVLRKIVYGMPDPESFDFEKFAVGGCCFEGMEQILMFNAGNVNGLG